MCHDRVIASRDNERGEARLQTAGQRRAAALTEERFLAEGLRLCTGPCQRLPPEDLHHKDCWMRTGLAALGVRHFW